MNVSTRRNLRWPVIAACLALAACTDAVDKAAKKRIFSPEDPPKVVASAGEKLAADSLADNAAAAQRVLTMGAAEATERLGPHKYSAAVRFDWAAGNRKLDLLENRTLEAGPGGVNGDFHGEVQLFHEQGSGARDEGVDVVRAEGRVFAKNRWARYRERKRDHGMAEREREEIYGGLRDLTELFRNQLALTLAGNTSYEGRSAYKYQVSLAAQDRATPASMTLPAPVQPKGGVDPSTRRRLVFFEQRKPTELRGELWVDAETAVVLRAKLDGKLAVPPADGQPEAVAHVSLDSSLSGIGTDPGIKVPNDFLPDEDKPEGIAATLDRFGIERAADDAGTPPGTQAKGAHGKAGAKDSKGAPEPEDDPQ